MRAAMAFSLLLGCGRVSTDPDSVEGGATSQEPSGGAHSAQGGTANHSGASPGESKGGITSGGASVASGGVASGGQATGGVSPPGGSAGASGAPGEPVGKNIWFRRGLLTLGETAFEKHLAFLLSKEQRPTSRYPSTQLIPGVEEPKELENTALALLGQTAVDALSDQELLAIFGCEASSGACSSETLSRFAQRAWHGQGSTAEIADLVAALSDLPAAAPLQGLRTILRRILSSPKAYVLKQLGQRVSSGAYVLDALERANLLAYGAGALTGDDALFEAAESGALLDPRELRAHAERLLETPAGERAVVEFVRGWFRISSAKELEAKWGEPPANAPSASSMLDETRYFIQALLAQNAPVSELVSADYTFVNASLAAFYGLPFQGDGFARADLSGTPRRGLLHHASWLASTSHTFTPSYPARALSVLGLLCEYPPPPPPGIDIDLVEPMPGLSRRQRMELETRNPACASCHKILDPIGFSFDHFDRLGRYQETEDGLPLDTSGSAHTFNGRDFMFDSSTALALQLAADPGLARCYATNLAAAWVGTFPSEPAANDYAARWDFTARDKGLREAILDWVESPYFFTREF